MLPIRWNPPRRRLCALVLVLSLWAGLGGVPAAASFADVPAGAYYAGAVSWAVARGVTNGTSETAFSPGRGCTRAHAVTFLWRADGSPEPSAGQSPFQDVVPGAYYDKAVRWAMEQGVTGGIDENRFGPDQPCSRAQIVTFLYRFAGSPAVSDGAGFRDVPAGAYYSRAVAWAAGQGITQGMADGTFHPGEACTRGQIVTFLHRYFAGAEPSPAAGSSPGEDPTSGTGSAGTGSAGTGSAGTGSTGTGSTGTGSAAGTGDAPSPEPAPAPQPGKVYHAGVESDLFREHLLAVIDSVEDGGGYYTSHNTSRNFPRTAWQGIHEAYTLTADRPSIQLDKARPSFCSAAVYLVMMKALLEWDTQEWGTQSFLSPEAWYNLKPWCLDDLEWGYQYDGIGCWGRANANGPGLAVLLAQLGAGESRYIGGQSDYSTRAVWLRNWDSAVPGDFLKIFWNNYIGASDSQNKGESGHLVVYLGREVSYLEDGTRDDWIHYWSSNGSGAQLNGGYGKSRCRASQIKRAVLTHVTDPAAFANAADIDPDDTDPWLSALDGKHLATVAELKAAITGADMRPWL